MCSHLISAKTFTASGPEKHKTLFLWALDFLSYLNLCRFKGLYNDANRETILQTALEN